jgi:hypothetical protein
VPGASQPKAEARMLQRLLFITNPTTISVELFFMIILRLLFGLVLDLRSRLDKFSSKHAPVYPLVNDNSSQLLSPEMISDM